MREEIIDRLLRLNQEFYQTFARSFAETRQRVQPGVKRAIQELPPPAAVLDLGCGNGSLARELARLEHHGPYIGLDSSAELIDIARRDCPHPQATFHVRDIMESSWNDDLGEYFDWVFAFAILHHIPTQALRQRIIKAAHRMLNANGIFTFSVWNFLASPRLRGRILPWERAGLSTSDVEPGDALLDWRHGGVGLRYVHAFDEAELSELAAMGGFRPLKKYHTDGAEGNLGYYHVWEPIDRPSL